MCLIIHQPAGHATPPALLESATAYNPDGFGFMGFRADGSAHVERSPEPGYVRARVLAEAFTGQPCVFHFRRRTCGSSLDENLHPFAVAPDLWLMHNGTASGIPIREPGRSDTWHLVHDYLRPLLGRRRELVRDRAFRRILDRWLGPHNRIVFLDAREGRIDLLHADDGHAWNGLWLSNTRWVDRRLLSLTGTDGVYRVGEARFCI